MQTWPDPFQHFEHWYTEAQRIDSLDVSAMALATATPDACPSVRFVYYKGLIAGAFSFYTNYLSRKGQELAVNNKAALLFYWQPLARQVRIEGTVQKLSREVSEQYFASRPLASQISALISQQSCEIPSYQSLQEKFAKAQKKYVGRTSIPCPPHWGGYALTPSCFEFFISEDNRLNQRILYQRTTDDTWQIKYLSP